MSYKWSSAEVEAGRWGEEISDRYFRSLGYGVIRVADINGGPAMLERDVDPLVLPDRIIVIPQIGSKYVEVKLKLGPIPFEISGTMRHGIDLPNWRHYLRLKEEAMVEIGLALVQIKDHRDAPKPAPRLLFQTIKCLNENVADIVDRPVNNFPHGAVFWELDVFQDLGLIGDLFGSRSMPATKLNLHPWERRSRNGTVPMPRNQGQGRFKW